MSELLKCQKEKRHLTEETKEKIRHGDGVNAAIEIIKGEGAI